VISDGFQPCAGRENVLVLGQVLVDLVVAPTLSSAVDAVDVELGCSDAAELETAENLGGLVNEKAERAGGGGKVQNIVAGKIRRRVAQNERVGQQMQQSAVLDLNRQIAVCPLSLGHRSVALIGLDVQDSSGWDA
jgi:hypothetical protein